MNLGNNENIASEDHKSLVIKELKNELNMNSI